MEALLDAVNSERKSSCANGIILYQTLDQICRGLLKYYFDYAPMRNALKHLLTVCNRFWPGPMDIVTQLQAMDENFINKISDTERRLRYSGFTGLEHGDVKIFQELCEYLYKVSNRISLEEHEKRILQWDA